MTVTPTLVFLPQYTAQHSNILAKPPKHPTPKISEKMPEAERRDGDSENPSEKQPEINGSAQKNASLFSPRFRSVAAMAGWDEEALLIASLIVEDTPDRQFKHKKRSDLQSFITPPSNSRRKRRAQRRSPATIPVGVLDLDEDEPKPIQVAVLDLDENEPKPIQESEKIDKEANTIEELEKKRGGDGENSKSSGVSSSIPAIPCIDQLREELSCAICLEICYEPSTTPCGHSFCKKCLRSAADKCGKRCPKCRQLISNGRYCTVNTVLWNTIQLLFPQEVEARKAAAASTSDSHHEPPPLHQIARSRSGHNTRGRAAIEALINSPPEESERSRRRDTHHRIRSRSSRVLSNNNTGPSQDEDAALALRLQREEFMEAFRASDHPDHNNRTRNSVAVARDNLRAMASRAINIRIRGRT